MKKYISLLIVDADTNYSAELAKYYRKMPFVRNVTTVTGYTGLVNEMQNDVYDMILLDAGVPIEGGLGICKQWKMKYKMQGLGIAVFSEMEDAFVCEAAAQNGACAYFAKTVDMDTLTRFLLDFKNAKLKGFVAELSTNQIG